MNNNINKLYIKILKKNYKIVKIETFSLFKTNREFYAIYLSSSLMCESIIYLWPNYEL